MKLYELMKILSKYPSGANVKVEGNLKIENLEQYKETNDDIYSIYADIEDTDVEDLGCDEVVVSLWMDISEQ